MTESSVPSVPKPPALVTTIRPAPADPIVSDRGTPSTTRRSTRNVSTPIRFRVASAPSPPSRTSAPIRFRTSSRWTAAASPFATRAPAST